MTSILQITDEAKQELTRFSQQDLEADAFIRIARDYQCSTSRFQLTVDIDQTPMDERVSFGDYETGGCTIVIEKSCLGLLDECTLDFNDRGFLFFDPAGSRC